MRVLISNDDGYQAPGIRVLAATLGEIAKVTVVAPDRDRSGASNSLTLDNPIRANRIDRNLIAVDGTPTDCVHLAITGLLDEEPDMVVAGINAGSNLGDDVLYSGTVAAAVEGRFLGYPAIAVSLAGQDVSHFDTAARVAKLLMLRLLEHPLPSDTILNVNVPDVPLNEIMGFATTRLGYRHKSEPVIKMQDPRGRDIYWVGPPGGEQDAGPGTDFHAVRSNKVSITPMHIDLTRHSAIEEISGWIEGAVFE
jgi:5'-nucleotidase